MSFVLKDSHKLLIRFVYGTMIHTKGWEEWKEMKKGHLNKKDLFLHRPSYSSISFALCGIPNPSLSSSLHFGQPPSVFSLFLSVGSREPVPFRNKSDQFGRNHSALGKEARYRINHNSTTPFCFFYLYSRTCSTMCICAHPCIYGYARKHS